MQKGLTNEDVAINKAFYKAKHLSSFDKKSRFFLFGKQFFYLTNIVSGILCPFISYLPLTFRKPM